MKKSLMLMCLAALMMAFGGCRSLLSRSDRAKSTGPESPKSAKCVEKKPMVNGKKHGRWVACHTNGKKKSEARYKDGEKHGTATSWHENGDKWLETHYNDGKKHGKDSSWSKAGKKTQECEFDKGKELKCQTF